MVTTRDDLLGQLTSCLGMSLGGGTFVGHESGVSVVVLHESLTDVTWDELEESTDPVEFARQRIAGEAGA